MSNKEQNSIEWLEEIYLTIGIDRNVHFNQAKAMHKQEICQFVSDYLDDAADNMTAEEYYDQIYKDNTP